MSLLRTGALALTLSLTTLPGGVVHAQTTSTATPRVRAVQLSSPPELAEFVRAMESDTRPDTAMSRVDRFVARFPRDGEPSSQRTEAYIGRDGRALYVVVLAYSEQPDRIGAHMVARDRIYDNDDSVAVQIDTFRDFRRAYGMQSNPVGSRADGFWVEGSGWSLDPDFDFALQTARTSRGYIVHYAIPFSSLNYPEGADEWGLLVFRFTPDAGEHAFWPAYSRKIPGRMNQAGILEGMADIPASPRGKVTPYVSANDLSVGGRANTDTRAGLDARWRINRSSELALTLNPDFGQIESDEPQIAANQRFELFFPEKRPFFADHARYFATPLNLLFTRRMSAPDAGLKAAGQSNGLTWATLAVRDDPADAEQRNLFAGRARYDLGSDLSLGLAAISLGDDQARNDVVSLDSRWQIGGPWTLEAQAAGSRDTAGVGSNRAGAQFLRLLGTGANWNANLNHRRIDHDFNASAGFVPRTGIHDSRAYLEWRHTPSSGPMTAIGPNLSLDYVTDERGQRLDRGGELSLVAQFPRESLLAGFVAPRRERLLPGEFPALAAPQDYSADLWGVRAATSIPFGSVQVYVAGGDAINLVPPAGLAPTQARFREGELGLSLRPSQRLTNDNTVLYTRLADALSGAKVFDQLVARSKWTYYVTPDWSVRLIGQYVRTRATPGRTALADEEGANVDLLLAWQPSPYRSWFLGYNSDYAAEAFGDFDPRRGALQRRARSLYLKFSWSFDFG